MGVFLRRKQWPKGTRRLHIGLCASSLAAVDSGSREDLSGLLLDKLEATEPWEKLLGKVLAENIPCAFGGACDWKFRPPLFLESVAVVFSNSASKLLETGIMVLQLVLGIASPRGFPRLLVLGSHGDPLEGTAWACGTGSGLASVSPLGSVLLLNDDSEVVVVVILVSLQRAKDDSFPTFTSCVQATLGVDGEQRELLSISHETLIVTNILCMYYIHKHDDLHITLNMLNGIPKGAIDENPFF